MTWFKIYRRLCTELEILYPFKQQEMTVPVNPIPNSLEFQLRNFKKTSSYDEYRNNLNHRAFAYYKICKQLGFDKVEELSENIETFKLKCTEHPDRYVNLHTVISVLYLSGFRDDELVRRSIKYLQGNN